MRLIVLLHPNTLGRRLGVRFAVHLLAPGDDLDPTELRQVLNAGWRPDLELAELHGADQAATARAAINRLTNLIGDNAHRAGPYTVERRDLDYFPPPPED